MRNTHPQKHENLAGEHAATDIGQLILLLLFLAIWITDSFVFHYSLVLTAAVPLAVRLPAALVLLGFSAYLAFSAHKLVFGAETQAGVLVTAGVFSLVRHPMYLGAWLFFCALTAATFSLAAAGVTLVTAVFYFRVARHEEKLLLEHFGAGYRQYCSRVPMLFPRLFGRGRVR